MQRLINTNASDRLAGALSQLGQLMKTLRGAIQRQLKRGEFSHILVKRL